MLNAEVKVESRKMGPFSIHFSIQHSAFSIARISKGGSNSVVESQPSKLLVAGSIPVSRSNLRSARLRERATVLGEASEREALVDCEGSREAERDRVGKHEADSPQGGLGVVEQR